MKARPLTASYLFAGGPCHGKDLLLTGGAVEIRVAATQKVYRMEVWHTGAFRWNVMRYEGAPDSVVRAVLAAPCAGVGLN